MVLSTSKSAVLSLSSSFGRQINLLPSGYLRQFFRIKLGDDVSAVLSTRDTKNLREKKLKKLQRELRILEEANSGKKKAMEHVLDLAYGRKGKLRWEIVEPLLTDPGALLPERIIPEVEKSRPPVYSPELRALLTSSYSRTTKPLSNRLLDRPPKIPDRADPDSEEAQLLGPFSKRREVNIRWRYFTTEIKKVLPPLQVALEQSPTQQNSHQMTDKSSLIQAGVRPIGLQGSGVMEEALAIAGPAYASPPKTRRERRSSNLNEQPASTSSSPLQTHLPKRFIRRRFRELLSRVPVVTCRPGSKSDNRSGRYSVTAPPNAVSNALRYEHRRLPMVDDVDLAWIDAVQKQTPFDAKQKRSK